MDVPVVVLLFNRPACTERLLKSLLPIRPRHLFVVADGARPDRPEEAANCQRVRELVTELVDWDCEIRTEFAKTNLGCGRRIATGLSWVFSQVEEAIILEDDCIPHPSFFSFCQELLDRYREDDRIVHISGNNFQDGNQRGPHSYFFSRYNHIWGWATWRRAWKHFDHKMRDWPLVKAERALQDRLNVPGEYEYWSNLFDQMVAQDPWPKTWGYAWTYSCFKNGLSVYPNTNLVSNIGFGIDATHCKGAHPHANLPVKEILLPFSHPTCFVENLEADFYTARTHFGISPLNRPNFVRRAAHAFRARIRAGMRPTRS